MDIPKMNKEMLIHVDSTPNDKYPLRILKAHRENCDCRYAVDPPDVFWDTMNEYQALRAIILDKAIRILEENL